jgi:hypothetical protein
MLTGPSSADHRGARARRRVRLEEDPIGEPFGRRSPAVKADSQLSITTGGPRR